MKLRHMFPLAALVTSALVLSTFAAAPLSAESSKVYHTVVFWLKPETPTAKVEEITRAIKTLDDLPMVEKVLVGTPIMSDREIVDDSFTIAFTMIFNDQASLSAYSDDPHHKKISSELTMPYVARGVIYDYQSQ